MLAMHPAQIYVVFQNIFLGKFDSTTFNHYLHSHANFRNKKFFNKRWQGIDSLDLNRIFFKKLLKSFWPMYLTPGS